MSLFSTILAQQDPLEQVHTKWIELLRQNFLLFGAFGTLALALLIWVAFVRKKGRKRRHRHPHNWERLPEERSSRHRHRSHKPSHSTEHRRNPTLAESGGLPPIRSQLPEPPETPSA